MMQDRSEKITQNENIENACPKCGGVGKIRMIPYGGHQPFLITCTNCNGEKVISQNLLDRKASAQKLTELLHDRDLTMREASRKFSQSLREWIRARQAQSSLEEIQEKIDLLEQV